ncbi:MAG TPA: hypothetical protein VFO20_05425, partial [Propionibacteriaceae bacterium]|nr:hypothetical protein [Propionibacteriaceae bacterium]
HPRGRVLYVGNLQPTADEFLTSRVDVVDHQLNAPCRFRLAERHALADGNRAGRTGGVSCSTRIPGPGEMS